MKRRARLGRFLASVPAAPFVSNLPPCLQPLVNGLVLSERTRPYVTKSGAVTVRLVFRDRAADMTTVVNWTLHGALSPELRDVLQAALGPGLLLRCIPMPVPCAAEIGDHVAR